MICFKDIIHHDIKNVFFNLDEFSELHSLNSKSYNIIIDNDTLSEKKLNGGIDDIYSSSILFYVKKSDLDFIPEIGKKNKV